MGDFNSQIFHIFQVFLNILQRAIGELAVEVPAYLHFYKFSQTQCVMSCAYVRIQSTEAHRLLQNMA
jgi:hypothetical protein